MLWSATCFEKYALNGLILCLPQPELGGVTSHTKERNLENPICERSARGPQNTNTALWQTATQHSHPFRP